MLDKARIVCDGHLTQVFDAYGNEYKNVTSVRFIHQAGAAPIAEVTLVLLEPDLDLVVSTQVKEVQGGIRNPA